MKNEQGSLLPSDPDLASAVAFHESKIPRLENAKLINGLVYDLPDNRTVEVWRIQDEEGFCIRIFRPTEDGKISRLVFGLKPAAAEALAAGLMNQLLNEKFTQAAQS